MAKFIRELYEVLFSSFQDSAKCFSDSKSSDSVSPANQNSFLL